MTYRITTRDGTAVMVEEVDVDLVTAYLVLRGYPPISVEVADQPSPKKYQKIVEAKA